MIEFKQNPLWILVIPFILLACWLGSRHLNEHPLWGDESFTIIDARGLNAEPRSLDEIWAGVAQRNPDHAPGYFLLLNLWARLVGWNPVVLRALSLFIGLVAIAVTYRLGRERLSAGVGLTAAIILSVSPFYAFFFDQMRVYTLMSLMSILTFWAYARLLNDRHPPRWWHYAALFLCVVATLYSHYLTMITLIGIGLYHLLFVPKNRRWWLISGVVIAAGLTFLPWASVLLHAVNKESDDLSLHLRALSTPDALFTFLWNFSSGAVVLMVGLLVAAFLRARGNSRAVPFVRQLLVISVGALVALLLTNQILQIMHPGRLRYMMPLWPLFALVLGVGFLSLRRWRMIRLAVLALWIVIGLWASFFVNFDGQLDGAAMEYPIDQVSRALIGYTEKNDVVVNYLPDDEETIKDETLEFYFKVLSRLPIQYTLADRRATPEAQLSQEQRLWKTFEGKKRIWIAYSSTHATTLLADFETKMKARSFQYCLSLTDQPDAILDLYVAPEASCPSANSPDP